MRLEFHGKGSRIRALSLLLFQLRSKHAPLNFSIGGNSSERAGGNTELVTSKGVISVLQPAVPTNRNLG